MKQAGALFIIICILFSLVLSGCGGGGGDPPPPPPPTSVTIKGSIDDGTASSPIANARCRFEQQGIITAETSANAAGEFTLSLDPDVEGFFLCHPPSLRRLTLSTFISTVGRVVGDEILGKNVTPASTVVVEILMQFPAAVRQGREVELQNDLAAQKPNITLLVEATTRLYKSLLTQQVNVDFADSESGEGGDADDGEAEGEAGDGAEGSPIPSALCEFALKLEDAVLVRSVLGDIFDNGFLNRPDLGIVRDQVPIADPVALATAFSALFPSGISHPVATVADDASLATGGRYRLRIPPAVPGIVRCVPPDQQQLRLATVIPALQTSQPLQGQDVTPQTTYFSTTIDDPATGDVAVAKEDFLNAIMGLVVEYVQENGEVTAFNIMDPDAVADEDVGLVAFSATALFNSLFLKEIEVDYVAALAAFFSGGTENREQAVASLRAFLEANRVAVEQVEGVAKSIDVSVNEAEQELGTTLEDALKAARLTVKVIDATTRAGVMGAMVNVIDPLGVVQCDNCPATTDEAGEARLMLSNVPQSATTITIETIAEGFGTTSVEANVAASAMVTTEVALGNGQFDLTVTRSGEGRGMVQSAPSGITCGDDCTESFAAGISVTLTATPDERSRFEGWSGTGCSGTAPCTVTMDQSRTVTATFAPTHHMVTVQMSGTGSGTVASSPPGINCSLNGGTVSGACMAMFERNIEVALSASPGDGSTFNGWGGGVCSGTSPCTVTVDQNHLITASFTAPPGTLTVQGSGSGSGTVTSNPSGISCSISSGNASGACSELYDFGTAVALTATGAVGSEFTGWSGGGCSGTNPCTVRVDESRTVTATFTLVRHALTVQGSGNGAGTVTSNPSGISCSISASTASGVCSKLYDFGAAVTLTAAGTDDSVFTGWSGGGCSGTGPCTVTMDQAITVMATFTRVEHTLTVSLAGNGSVTSDPDGINCGNDCNEDYADGTQVTLTTEPDSGNRFIGWSGDGCEGVTELQCTVIMDQAHMVTATFSPIGPPVISNIRQSGETRSEADCTSFDGEPFTGDQFFIVFDYRDPDGDASKDDGATVQAFGSSDATSFSTFDGDGFEGSITSNLCAAFDEFGSRNVNVSLTDGAGNISNGLTITVKAPEGTISSVTTGQDAGTAGIVRTTLPINTRYGGVLTKEER